MLVTFSDPQAAWIVLDAPRDSWLWFATFANERAAQEAMQALQLVQVAAMGNTEASDLETMAKALLPKGR